MIMKKLFFVAALSVCSVAGFAQVETSSEDAVTSDSASNEANSSPSTTSGISDEDLRKYAETMDSVNRMKETLLNDIANKVRANTAIPVDRYNELYKVVGDQAKLAELKATPEEIAFINEVNDFKNQGVARINENFQTMARDYVGVANFNKIKNSLSTDDALKAKYDQIYGEIAGPAAPEPN